MDINSPWLYPLIFLFACSFVGTFLWWHARTPASERRPAAAPTAPARAASPARPAVVDRPRSEAPLEPTTTSLPTYSWPMLLDTLAKRPHIGIAGPSRQGKSVLSMALTYLRAVDGHQLVILNSHARPNDYGGLPQVYDYPAINRVMKALLAELGRRKAAAATGADSFDPITVVLEEAPDVMSKVHGEDGSAAKPKVPVAQRFVGEMLRQAAKYRMHLILVTQTTLVKPLGIEGDSEALDNLLWIAIGDRALEKMKSPVVAPWPAAIEWNCQWFWCDREPAWMLSTRPIDTARLWRVPDSMGDAVGDSPLGTMGTSDESLIDEATLTDVILITKLILAGKSGNEIIDSLGGKRTRRLSQIRQVKQVLDLGA
ncbi:MAG TPA: hypothetical protein DEF47_11275 [Herpetosiphon sp.]|uniref:FtsK domain-containing protein n=1 Tax=Herpetosiphon aurantiacus (strain ATCC 23779 / DSM 785 / 114-95) TaxID=316274 RepID=A9AWS0_HERA2|nr:hypothetical protein [Herpetosiphon sp.]ABX03321.1 hypothetical protein Haur_0673 [Herpetosiphon aurantiacus DSM 785]HBW50475.1 hypothetical protein [Herpetosiphon sp.]